MGEQNPSTRRRFVTAVAGTTIVGTAGCLGGDGGSGTTPGQPQDGGQSGSGGNESTDDGSNSGGGAKETDGSEGGGGKTVTISIVSNRFEPQIEQLAVGDTVKFVCEDGFHTATLYHPDTSSGLPRRAPSGAGGFASGSLSPGNSFEVTLETAGVYDYFCRPHEDKGMVGSLVVGENTDPNQPGLSAPSNVPEEATAQLQQLNGQARSILGIGGDGNDGGGNDGGGGNVGGGRDEERREEEREREEERREEQEEREEEEREREQERREEEREREEERREEEAEAREEEEEDEYDGY